MEREERERKRGELEIDTERRDPLLLVYSFMCGTAEG